MNRNRKFQVASLSFAAGMLVIGASFTSDATPIAGATAMVSADQETVSDNTYSTLSGVDLALAGMITDAQDSTVEAETATADKKEKDLGVAKVNDYVNVRKKANKKSKVVGKLYKNNVVNIKKEKDGWYKITSGDVEGYVSSDFINTSDKAVAKAGKRVATVKDASTLKIRKKASKKASVVGLVSEGAKLEVKDETKADDGWVKVSSNQGTGYVSTDYVKVKTKYTYGETIEQEKARLEKEAAAAAAKAEAEAAAAAQAEQAASTGNSSKSTKSVSSNRSANTGSSSSSRSSSSSSSSNRSSRSYEAPSGGSGSAVASYACQFVGNPYVWGGTSLTNGADCSGFVMSVYRAFGVSLPHSSSADRGVGRGVSSSSMQPGDIVCYSGHVAIYIGGGQIVHASNSRDGIKISNANYRNIVAVRRIF